MQERGVFLCNVFLQRALKVFGKASSGIKGGRGREFVDVCVHISPRGAFGIRRFCLCVCAHLLRGGWSCGRVRRLFCAHFVEGHRGCRGLC